MTPQFSALAAAMLLAARSADAVGPNETWSLLPPPPWSPRTASNLVLYDGGAVLVGGGDSSDAETASSEVWGSADGTEWTRLTGNATFSPRLGGASSSDASYIILAGGAVLGSPITNSTANASLPQNVTFLNDVWRSSDGGRTWEVALAQAPWSPRAGHACTSFLGSFWILGGVGAPLGVGAKDLSGNGSGGSASPPLVFSNEVWRTADAGATWERVANTSAMWSPRAYAAVAINSGARGVGSPVARACPYCCYSLLRRRCCCRRPHLARRRHGRHAALR